MNYNDFRRSQKTFSSSDGELKYIDEGEGQVIVLLHGVPSSGWLYRKMIDGLVAGGYRVIVPDMLGFGSSDSPLGYAFYSAEQHGKRLIELMDGLKVEKWTHIMHDAGGLWTWEMLKKSTNRLENLVLLNTIIYEEGFRPPVRMREGIFAKFAMWLYRKKATRNILLRQLFKQGLKNKKLSAAELEGYKEPLKEGKTNGMYSFFTKTSEKLVDYSGIIDKINVPVAIIWGKHDSMLQWTPQAKKVVTNLKVKEKNVYILDANHFIQEEKPKEIVTILLNFLKNG